MKYNILVFTILSANSRFYTEMDHDAHFPEQVDPLVTILLASILHGLLDPRMNYLGILLIYINRSIDMINQLNLDDEESQLAYFIYHAFVMITNDHRCTPDIVQAIQMYDESCPFIDQNILESGYVSPFHTLYLTPENLAEKEPEAIANDYIIDFVDAVRVSLNPAVQLTQFIADVAPVITDPDYFDREDAAIYHELICDAFEQNYRIAAYIEFISQIVDDFIG